MSPIQVTPMFGIVHSYMDGIKVVDGSYGDQCD